MEIYCLHRTFTFYDSTERIKKKFQNCLTWLI